jgi:hypothetical protein
LTTLHTGQGRPLESWPGQGLVGPRLRALHVHAYRMLGSLRHGYGIMVFTIVGDSIPSITGFLSPGLFERVRPAPTCE